MVFQKLSGENLTKIAHLLVDDLRQRLIANGMNIKLTDAAYDKIVAEGTDLTNGARPLRQCYSKAHRGPAVRGAPGRRVGRGRYRPVRRGRWQVCL